jgi:hypothetical protein
VFFGAFAALFAVHVLLFHPQCSLGCTSFDNLLVVVYLCSRMAVCVHPNSFAAMIFDVQLQRFLSAACGAQRCGCLCGAF